MEALNSFTFPLFCCELIWGNIIYASHFKLTGAMLDWGFPRSSVVKNLPEVHETQKTRVQFLDPEDLLEEETAPHSSILAWEIPWTEEPAGLQSLGSQRVGHV